jgi:hypothetical protein
MFAAFNFVCFLTCRVDEVLFCPVRPPAESAHCSHAERMTVGGGAVAGLFVYPAVEMSRTHAEEWRKQSYAANAPPDWLEVFPQSVEDCFSCDSMIRSR